MSMELLQRKIRKTKCPVVLDFDITKEHLPSHLLQEEIAFPKAYGRFCVELMEGLRGLVPAVKFNFAGFALMGTEGLVTLSRVLDYGHRLGFYVLLEVPDALSAQRANSNARMICDEDNGWLCDGIVLSSYIGSDGIKPYAMQLENTGKSLFVVVRTGNRSAMELQDLLTGGRNVYDAKADIANRYVNGPTAQAGYHAVGIVGSGASDSILHKLREKYKNSFILVDGGDYPNANAKKCAEAFDRLGHGAAVSCGISVTAAWLAAENDGKQYVDDAIAAMERMKKNLARYVTVL